MSSSGLVTIPLLPQQTTVQVTGNVPTLENLHVVQQRRMLAGIGGVVKK